ncbi:WXG100 family type VII secretion target [Klenkia marina]|uniref:WXG100 family type VII secretion target n=1 Tax=Klenkia marina TaxID=1960309 RepID=A0A1G4XX44_9ACTN|nr:WXG100 family type VII secretion target [Klenkia marina]SCX45739.1 WXG100 family type VII secretion target [Klenkia marina]
MADGTGASPEQMAAFARSASEASQQLTSLFTSLNSNLATLESQSRGQFAAAFAQVKSTVATESANMNAALGAIAQSVGQAGVNYTQGDADQKSLMTNVEGTTTGITSGLVR